MSTTIEKDPKAYGAHIGPTLTLTFLSFFARSNSHNQREQRGILAECYAVLYVGCYMYVPKVQEAQL